MGEVVTEQQFTLTLHGNWSFEDDMFSITYLGSPNIPELFQDIKSTGVYKATAASFSMSLPPLLIPWGGRILEHKSASKDHAADEKAEKAELPAKRMKIDEQPEQVPTHSQRRSGLRYWW